MCSGSDCIVGKYQLQPTILRIDNFLSDKCMPEIEKEQLHKHYARNLFNEVQNEIISRNNSVNKNNTKTITGRRYCYLPGGDSINEEDVNRNYLKYKRKKRQNHFNPESISNSSEWDSSKDQIYFRDHDGHMNSNLRKRKIDIIKSETKIVKSMNKKTLNQLSTFTTTYSKTIEVKRVICECKPEKLTLIQSAKYKFQDGLKLSLTKIRNSVHKVKDSAHSFRNKINKPNIKCECELYEKNTSSKKYRDITSNLSLKAHENLSLTNLRNSIHKVRNSAHLFRDKMNTQNVKCECDLYRKNTLTKKNPDLTSNLSLKTHKKLNLRKLQNSNHKARNPAHSFRDKINRKNIKCECEVYGKNTSTKKVRDIASNLSLKTDKNLNLAKPQFSLYKGKDSTHALRDNINRKNIKCECEFYGINTLTKEIPDLTSSLKAHKNLSLTKIQNSIHKVRDSTYSIRGNSNRRNIRCECEPYGKNTLTKKIRDITSNLSLKAHKKLSLTKLQNSINKLRDSAHSYRDKISEQNIKCECDPYWKNTLTKKISDLTSNLSLRAHKKFSLTNLQNSIHKLKDSSHSFKDRINKFNIECLCKPYEKDTLTKKIRDLTSNLSLKAKKLKISNSNMHDTVMNSITRIRKAFQNARDSIELYKKQIIINKLLKEWECNQDICESSKCDPAACYDEIIPNRRKRKINISPHKIITKNLHDEAKSKSVSCDCTKHGISLNNLRENGRLSTSSFEHMFSMGDTRRPGLHINIEPTNLKKSKLKKPFPELKKLSKISTTDLSTYCGCPDKYSEIFAHPSTSDIGFHKLTKLKNKRSQTQYDISPPKVVRFGSNFSFNVEFYKDINTHLSNYGDEEPYIKKSEESVKHALRRCLCMLKLKQKQHQLKGAYPLNGTKKVNKKYCECSVQQDELRPKTSEHVNSGPFLSSQSSSSEFQAPSSNDVITCDPKCENIYKKGKMMNPDIYTLSCSNCTILTDDSVAKRTSKLLPRNSTNEGNSVEKFGDPRKSVLRIGSNINFYLEFSRGKTKPHPRSKKNKEMKTLNRKFKKKYSNLVRDFVTCKCQNKVGKIFSINKNRHKAKIYQNNKKKKIFPKISADLCECSLGVKSIQTMKPVKISSPAVTTGNNFFVCDKTIDDCDKTFKTNNIVSKSLSNCVCKPLSEASSSRRELIKRKMIKPRISQSMYKKYLKSFTTRQALSIGSYFTFQSIGHKKYVNKKKIFNPRIKRPINHKNSAISQNFLKGSFIKNCFCILKLLKKTRLRQTKYKVKQLRSKSKYKPKSKLCQCTYFFNNVDNYSTPKRRNGLRPECLSSGTSKSYMKQMIRFLPDKEKNTQQLQLINHKKLKKRDILKVGSSISLNINLYKQKTNGKFNLNSQYNKKNKRKKKKTSLRPVSVREYAIQCSGVRKRINKKTRAYVTTNEKGVTTSSRKRCFCFSKLPKRKNKMENKKQSNSIYSNFSAPKTQDKATRTKRFAKYRKGYKNCSCRKNIEQFNNHKVSRIDKIHSPSDISSNDTTKLKTSKRLEDNPVNLKIVCKPSYLTIPITNKICAICGKIEKDNTLDDTGETSNLVSLLKECLCSVRLENRHNKFKVVQNTISLSDCSNKVVSPPFELAPNKWHEINEIQHISKSIANLHNLSPTVDKEL